MTFLHYLKNWGDNVAVIHNIPDHRANNTRAKVTIGSLAAHASEDAVTLWEFSCNLSRDAIARQAAGIIAQCSTPCNGKNVGRLVAETVVESIIDFY